jgi:PAS domain S-box-containing protein/putative nucleotidyltransferase with HDIG domain
MKSRIMIIEDELIVSESIKMTLEQHGYKPVRCATSGEQALEEIEQDPPDLIIMDIVLAGEMNGIGTAEKIKEHYSIPVIYLTAYADEDIIHRASITEPYGYIIKPFNERELRSAVEMALFKSRTDKALRVSEQKYRSIFENAVEGIFQTTPEGQYLSVNPALARMLGYDSPDELINETVDLSMQIYVNPEDRAKFKSILEEQGIIERFETQHYRKDGSKIWVSINARVVKDETGKVLYYEGTIEDFSSRKFAEESLQQTTEKLKRILAGTINAISLTVETRDPYTAGHQKRVSSLARAIAQELELSDDAVENIRMAGIIHDIGKMSIPAEILSKPTDLTDIEFSLIKVHSRAGYDILKDSDLPFPIAEIVLQHHERLDGSGYPQGLKGDQALLEARILAVADVVEAIASHRPYRPAKGINAALEEIEKNKGILYDAKVADVCLKLFREKGFCFE